MEIILCKVNYCINLICFDLVVSTEGGEGRGSLQVELFENFSISQLPPPLSSHHQHRFQSILSVVLVVVRDFFSAVCIQSNLLY
jgi:hypothetical protein